MEIGRGARLVGNFEDDKELFVLFSRFADQLRSLPLFASGAPEPSQVAAEASDVPEKTVEADVEVVDGESGDEPMPVGRQVAVSWPTRSFSR